MSPETIGATSMLVLLVLILARFPIAIAMGLVGIVGYAAIDGWQKSFAVIGQVPLELASGYSLSVVPLFALMGAVAATAGLSSDLFKAANVLFGGMRGSLAMSAVGASAAFGAVCGSSLATAATMSRVSIPEMLRAGYHPRLAAGAVAAGGTLGILIPPSLILMIYAIIAQQSVAVLFAAALLPGIVLTGLYLSAIAVLSLTHRHWMPKLPIGRGRERVAALVGVWHVAALFFLTLGGIYLGWFSPTEAAAVGAGGALLLGTLMRAITFRKIATCFLETVKISASLFFIILGSLIFSYFMVQTKLSVATVDWIRDLGVSQTVLILLITAIYIVLGCFLESIGMILVTVPIFLPVVVANGIDPIWFGVLLVVVVEIGLITPPVGMNLFVLRTQAPEIGLSDVMRGVAPFLVAPLVLIVLMIVLPGIVLWLPRALY